MELEKLAGEIGVMQRIAEQIDDPEKAHFALQITRHCRWALDSLAEVPGMIDDQIAWWPAQFARDRRD
ncbi:hypothetical protein [Sphingomonas sp. CROZ-RG-20F-R02-07]|uniref:hypothetical protein n=1 Tax=Sphingomonas sp. CROZ-RG-20F-R02-07 TaxID=2914832 RepID=UPI001F5790FC|nr:hypothetical protein [Sphingomonas sp. CROZ-RG-20F-R02-07]